MSSTHIVGYCKICKESILNSDKYQVDSTYGLVHIKCLNKREYDIENKVSEM